MAYLCNMIVPYFPTICMYVERQLIVYGEVCLLCSSITSPCLLPRKRVVCVLVHCEISQLIFFCFLFVLSIHISERSSVLCSFCRLFILTWLPYNGNLVPYFHAFGVWPNPNQEIVLRVGHGLGWVGFSPNL